MCGYCVWVVGALCAGAVCGVRFRSNLIVSFSILWYLSFECPRLADLDEKVRNLNRSSFSKKRTLIGSRICLDDFALVIAIDVRSERISTDLDGQDLRSFLFPA